MALSTTIVLTLTGRIIGGLQDRLQSLATTDGLTGLSNRRQLDVSLTSEIAWAIRRQSPLTLLFLDLDGLKAVNDQRGHAEGDRVLREAARALRSGTGISDTVARIGGDEFAILLRDTTLADGTARGEALREAIHHIASNPQVTISIGVVELARVSQPTPEALLEAADRALYEAKRTGRDRVVVAAPPGDR